MPKELLQNLVSAFIGAVFGYLINQLPPLKTFRRSWVLVVTVVTELAVLGAIWAWLSGDAAQTSNVKGLVEKIGAVLLGAFLVNILQLFWGVRWSKQSTQSTSFQPPTNQRTSVKGTTIQGDRNKLQVDKNNADVHDTDIKGNENEFSVTENSHTSASSPQNNPPNP